jgi:outer membrane immunogenic protein
VPYHQLRGLFAAGVAAAVLCSVPALGADMPVKAPAPPVAAFIWAGLYAGVHAGYGWGTYDHLDADFVGNPTANFDPKGGFGGVQIGSNSLITQNWLLGSEVDFSGGDIRGSGFDTVAPPITNRVSDKVDFFGTARVRLGYVVDRALIYGTGGVAWAHANGKEQGLLTNTIANEHYVGWAAGGGIEYAFDPRWSLKLEYLYSDLGVRREATAFGGGGNFNHTDLTLSTVKLGLNYHVGDPVASSNSTVAMPLKAAPAPRFSWNGSYVGAHAGFAWSQFDGVQSNGFAVPPFFVESLRPRGWFGGFQAGYNWQFAPTWVFGIETDNSFVSLKASGIATAPGGVAPAMVKVDDLGTIRARLGYALDRSLIYSTGGLAYAHQRSLINPFGTLIGADIYDVGWTAGGGLEYAFDPRWSAKVEYLYADLGGQSTQEGAFDHTSLKIQTVKLGLNYKFDLGELLRGR